MQSDASGIPSEQTKTTSATVTAVESGAARTAAQADRSFWLLPLLSALAGGWLSSLNGYGVYLPLVMPAFAFGVALVALRMRLPTRVRTQVLNPALVAFAGAVVAMLVGSEIDLGPRGLAVLASWCVTTPLSAADLLFAKLALLPTAHALMVAACMLHLLVAREDPAHVLDAGPLTAGRRPDWWRRCQRCALVALSLPLVLLATDSLVLGIADPSALNGARSDWLSTAMVLTMAALMALSAVVIRWLTPFAVKH